MKSTPRNTLMKLSKAKTKNLESSKREVTHHIQYLSNNINSQFLL